MCLAQRECLASLSDLGFEVDVLCPPGGQDFPIPGVRVLRLAPLPFFGEVPIGPSWAKLAYGATMGLTALARLSNGRYEAVHACEESAFLAAALKTLFGVRFVYDMDDVLTRRLEAAGVVRLRPALAVLRAVERWMIRAADAVLTNSLETTAFAREAAGVERVFFYDHLPPLEPARGAGSPRARLRRRRALGVGKRPLIVYAGNLERYQGVHLLIEGMPRLHERFPEARLAVVGGLEAQIEALRLQARRLGVEAAVRFLGRRPVRCTLGLLDAADALVSPMIQVKAVPMKVYAYLAAGRPIVATALSNHEQLLDCDSAVLVPPTSTGLADGLAAVLSDGPLAVRLERGSRALARSRLRSGSCARALAWAYAASARGGARVGFRAPAFDARP